jgi:hypothetical protein
MTLYLYAIVPASSRAAYGRGIGRSALSTVAAGGARVVVERASSPSATIPAIRAHDRVVRRIARRCSAVLPFRFGSSVADAKTLRSLLEPLALSIARALDHVQGCVQVTMRVYGRAAPIRSPRASGPGTRFLLRLALSRRVPEVLPIAKATSSHVRDVRVERHATPPLVASVYHLVPREHLAAFRAAVASASRELRGVRVEVTGPWPPYAFAELP